MTHDHLLATYQRLRSLTRHVLERWLPVAAMLLALLAANDSQAQAQNATALETFDQVWNQVREQYFDYERIEADWEQAREELRPLAAERSQPDELRPLLQDLLGRIGESHFVVVPGQTINRLAELDRSSRADDDKDDRGDSASGAPSVEAMTGAASRADTVTTGLTLRLVGNQVRVASVRADSPADHAGIEPGWRVEALDGSELADTLASLANIDSDDERRRAVVLLELGLQGMASLVPAQSEVELRLINHQDEVIETRLRGQTLSHATTQIGNLPPMAFDFQLERQAIDQGCAQVMAFSSWVPALTETFQGEREAVFACQGLVIDLRGNPGGVMTTMVPLAADLFDESVVLGSLLRSDARLDFRVLPRRVAMDGQRLQPFDGPIAILIDSLSASTSEMFAAGMQATGRAKLFGERSAGMALPSQMLPLANGDFLMYAFADYRDSQDRRIEGVGALPDFPVSLNDDNIHQQPSPVLQAALDWINQELSP